MGSVLKLGCGVAQPGATPLEQRRRSYCISVAVIVPASVATSVAVEGALYSHETQISVGSVTE